MLWILAGVWAQGDLAKPVPSSRRAGPGPQGMGPGPQGAGPDRQEAEPCGEGRGLHRPAAPRRSLVLWKPNLNFEGHGFCPQDLGGGAWASPGGAWAPGNRRAAPVLRPAEAAAPH